MPAMRAAWVVASTTRARSVGPQTAPRAGGRGGGSPAVSHDQRGHADVGDLLLVVPSADPGGLEEHEGLGAGTRVGPARGAFRYGLRHRRIDDIGGVDRVPDTQSDPQVDVGLDLGGDHAAGTLCGQHEVDAEDAAAQRRCRPRP